MQARGHHRHPGPGAASLDHVVTGTADQLDGLNPGRQRASGTEKAASEPGRPSAPHLELVVFATLATSVAVWLASLLRFDPNHLRAMTDVGLISILPKAALAASLVLTASFCFTLWRLPRNRVLPLLHVLALIVMLFGTPALIEQEPHFAIAWQHAGIADAVMRTGQVYPDLDIYGNWPGFFIGLGFLAKAIGVSNPIVLADWASVFFNVLYLAPLLLLYRSTVREPRTIWIAVWLFYVGNWVGQDYLSPQAVGYLFYLGAIALLIRVIAADGPASSSAYGPGDRTRGTTVGQVSLALLLALACIPTHQLTPVQIILSVALLTFTSRRLPNALPVLIGTAMLAWALYMATPYLEGHLNGIIGGVGNVASSVDQSSAQRLAGSPGHLFVTHVRLILAGVVVFLAVLGAFRLWRQRSFHALELRLAGLAVIPIFLPAIQSYGGEVGLRAYLYALPFLSFFGAHAIGPRPHGSRVGARPFLIAVAVLVLLLEFAPFARYGNERADFFTVNERRAVDYAYSHTRPGSLIAAVTWTLPWRYRDYETRRYSLLDEMDGWQTASATGRWKPFVRTLGIEMSRESRPAYLVVTRSQLAAEELYGAGSGNLKTVIRLLRNSPRFRVAYLNGDSIVFAPRRRA